MNRLTLFPLVLSLAILPADAGMTKLGTTLDNGTVYASINDNITSVRLVHSDGQVYTGKYEINCSKSAYRKVGTAQWERIQNKHTSMYMVMVATCKSRNVAMDQVPEKYAVSPDGSWTSKSRVASDGSMRVRDIVSWDHNFSINVKDSNSYE